MSGVSVSVRVTNVVTDRQFAICVDGATHGLWVIEVEAARQLHHDLGEALDALVHLEPELHR